MHKPNWSIMDDEIRIYAVDLSIKIGNVVTEDRVVIWHHVPPKYFSWVQEPDPEFLTAIDATGTELLSYISTAILSGITGSSVLEKGKHETNNA